MVWAMESKGLAIVLQAVPSRLHPRPAGDCGDAAMVVSDKTLRCGLSAVTSAGITAGWRRSSEKAVEQDDRQCQIIKPCWQRNAAGEDRHIDQSAGTFFDHGADCLFVHLGIVHGLCDQDQMTVSPRCLT